MMELDETSHGGMEDISLPSPGNVAEESERRNNLHATLSDLPDRQREVVVLRYFEDLSTEQTAVAMNCAVGTVKATLHQALRSLRGKMKQWV
jgi:RNA polymerase sigma factor (sigma-70 family)